MNKGDKFWTLVVMQDCNVDILPVVIITRSGENTYYVSSELYGDNMFRIKKELFKTETEAFLYFNKINIKQDYGV